MIYSYSRIHIGPYVSSYVNIRHKRRVFFYFLGSSVKFFFLVILPLFLFLFLFISWYTQYGYFVFNQFHQSTVILEHIRWENRTTNRTDNLITGKQDRKCPVALLTTCCGSQSFQVILIDSDFPTHPALNSLVTLYFTPSSRKDFFKGKNFFSH
jgi:hypothetical protein